MPSRRDIFINENIYHVFDKTLDHKNVFLDRKLAALLLDLITYYRSQKADLRYSHFKRLPEAERKNKEKQVKVKKYFKVEILGYCLMYNHFHLLLQQNFKDGIIRFMSDVLNSLTRFYNILNERNGPLFLPQFRSRHIISNDQLKHVSRYKHLNPYSGGIVKSLEALENYEFSSFKEYLNPKVGNISNSEVVLKLFGGNRERYKKFVFANAEHQRTLEFVKYSMK